MQGINILLLTTDQYFGSCYCISNNKEYRCNGAKSRERDSRKISSCARSERRSDNLYRAWASAIALGRSWINIRWLIWFRADRGVAFLKFSANCPRAAPHPRPFFSFSLLFLPSYNLAAARPLVSSYYFRRQPLPVIIHILKGTPYTAYPTLLAAPRGIISKNICGIDVAIIITKRMALD